MQSNATPSLSQMITNERSVALRPWHVAVWQAASEKMKEDGRWDSEGWDWEHEDGLREGREREAASQQDSSDNLWWGGKRENKGGEVGHAANVSQMNHVGWREREREEP